MIQTGRTLAEKLETLSTLSALEQSSNECMADEVDRSVLLPCVLHNTVNYIIVNIMNNIIYSKLTFFKD